eukprot:TRINITY_DN4663_c0_g1_i1.p1 TRINITY_DN4663_c0_g1~~TRINITY_DN4663_c0_g1_i1.p1  ORF type:complete len:187 (-),score=37.59 TRINITY_DN4663_c0_g1_i1:141-671(-)
MAGRVQLASSKDGSVTKRLQGELMSMMMSKQEGVSAFPDGGNMMSWTGTITGAKDTVYESLTYKLSLRFPTDYPFSAPTVKFVTPCFHPNVDNHGNICLDILKDKWSAIYNVSTILISIQSLLAEPNIESPLNGYASGLWENQSEYKEVLMAKYREAQSGATTNVSTTTTTTTTSV